MAWTPHELLKVFNYVNDERRPKVNVKFIGAAIVVIGAVAAIAGVGLYMSMQGGGSSGPVASETKTDYVELTPAEAAQAALDGEMPAARLDSWAREHPGAEVKSIEPVERDGVLVGYNIRYVQH